MFDCFTVGCFVVSGNVAGTFMVSGAWELGVRFQDFDDTADSTLMDLGANYYANGHDFKYIINWASLSSDNGDTDTLTIGVNARF